MKPEKTCVYGYVEISFVKLIRKLQNLQRLQLSFHERRSIGSTQRIKLNLESLPYISVLCWKMQLERAGYLLILIDEHSTLSSVSMVLMEVHTKVKETG